MLTTFSNWSFDLSSPMKENTNTLRPPLKWAGGKRWLVPYLRLFWKTHSHRRLVEPFMGGLAIALGLNPKRALLNDTNVHLVNFYNWLKQGLHISIELANDTSLYYEHRSRFNQLVRESKSHTEEAASLFYYLNRTGFNGLCRFNSKGEFNVPVGRYKTINYVMDFSQYIEIFQNWEFSASDFSQIQIRDDDLIYADPPYDVEFTSYSPGGFTWADQVRLINWLDSQTVPVIASNQATDRIIRLYEQNGFNITILEGPRKISSNGDRSPAREMLATRNV